MHIIFGTDEARALQNKYTVLELDTFRFLDSDLVIPAYCIIENVAIGELPELDRIKNLHSELIANYAKQNWTFCLEAIPHLIKKWGGEMDTFYHDLHSRIQTLQANPPGLDWSPIILKTTS